MEIISYLKGKKAQEAIRDKQKIIGQDEFMHGDKDVSGSYKDADERINELEKKSKDRTLSTRVEKITEDTMVRLNKNALRVASLINAEKFNHTNLVFEDFTNLESIDVTKSKNIVHYPASSEIGQANSSTNAKIISKPISSNGIKLLTFDLAISDGNTITTTLNYINVESTKNIEISETLITLLRSGKVSNGVDNYHESGEIVFTPQEHSSEVTLKRMLYNTSSTPSSEVEIWIRHKESNEKEWSTYEKALSGLKYNPIIQFKMVINNTKSTHANVINLPDSKLSEGFSFNGNKVVTNNTFTRDMVNDDSVNRYLVKRNEWNSIDKISITPSGSRALIYHNGEYKKWVPYKAAVAANFGNVMTSGGSITATSRYGSNNYYHSSYAFNGVKGSKYTESYYSANVSLPHHLGKTFSVAYKPSYYTISTPSNTPTRVGINACMPKSWEFQGYTGSSWVTLHSYSQSSWSTKNTYSYSVSTNEKYYGFRLLITQGGRTSPKGSFIEEFEVFAQITEATPAVPGHWEVVELSEIPTKGMSDLSILNYSSSNKPFEQLEGDFEIISDSGSETVKIESFMSNSEISISLVKVNEVKSININATVSSGATLSVLCSKDNIEWNEYALSDFNSLTPDQVSALFNDTIYLKIICNRTSKASTATINSITINSEEYKTTPSISNLLYEYKLENKGVYKIQYSIDSGITWNEASTNELIKIEEKNKSLIWYLEIKSGQRLQCISYSYR